MVKRYALRMVWGGNGRVLSFGTHITARRFRSSAGKEEQEPKEGGTLAEILL